MMDNLPIPWLIRMDDRLANGRGMTNCELVGMSGGCRLTCPVLLAGECEVEDEMLSHEDCGLDCPAQRGQEE